MGPRPATGGELRRRTLVLAFGLALALAASPAAAQEWGWEGLDATSDEFTRPRFFAALAPDAAGTQAVLFGGNPSGPSNPDPYADTWTIEGPSWTPRCGTSVPGADGACGPPARFAHGMGSGPNGVIMFGGADAGGGALGDTWRWDGSAWAIVCDATGCPPGNGDPQPSARGFFAMAGNGTHVVLYGGIGTGLNSDTWVWDGSSWTEVCDGCAPGPLGGSATAWDGEKFVMFGGQANLEADANADTWAFVPGVDSDWTLLCGEGASACGPPPRAQHMMGGTVSGNPGTDGVVMVGGSPQPGIPDTALADSWLFSQASDAWTDLGDGPWINAEGVPCGGPAALTGGVGGGWVLGVAFISFETTPILGAYDLEDAVATLCQDTPPEPDPDPDPDPDDPDGSTDPGDPEEPTGGPGDDGSGEDPLPAGEPTPATLPATGGGAGTPGLLATFGALLAAFGTLLAGVAMLVTRARAARPAAPPR